jgi:dTDP-4-amino-4,6-dideoxygalactose transaminase
MKNNKDSFNDPKIKVPFFVPSLSASDKKAVLEALNEKLLTDGPKLIQFENAFSNYVHSKYAVGVSNATSALHLSLKALGIGKNDEVIVPDLTFVATINAVLLTGAKPVIVDVDKESKNISPDSILSSISDRTKAIIPVHFAGLACDMTKIMKIAKSKKLFVIEDCAHAIGTKFKNKHVGTFGDFGCFSFYPTKNITTIEGGMVISKNKTLIDHVRIIRNHGILRSLKERYSKGYPWDYDIKEAGYNYRLDEIRSSLGISQLKRIQIINKKRQNAFKYYNKHFKNIDGLSVPTEKNIVENACHLYILRIKKKFPISRNKLFEKLLSSGIRTTVHYKPLHKFSIYRKLGIIRDNLTNSNELYNEILSLPLYHMISKKEQDLVITLIKNEIL